jgi:hypothetical protein
MSVCYINEFFCFLNECLEMRCESEYNKLKFIMRDFSFRSGIDED